jgi:hypothetical protein
VKVIDGLVRVRAPEGSDWPLAACADLSVESEKGPSAAVYLTPGDCAELARRLDEMWGKVSESDALADARRSRNDARLELAFVLGALSKRRARRLYRKARAALADANALGGSPQ